MNRRTFVVRGGAAVATALAGCYGPSEPTSKTVEPPALTGEDLDVEEPYTTFEIGWNAVATPRFDLDTRDGRKVTAPEGSVYLLVLAEVRNVGDRSMRFRFDKVVVESGDERYFRTRFPWKDARFPASDIDPGGSVAGWVPYEIPRELSSGTIRVVEEAYFEPPAVTFHRDSSIEPPF